MLERIAAPKPPLACYGLEQSLSDARCLECVYRTGCREAMGMRFGRGPSNQTQFRFIPELLSGMKYSPEEDLKIAYDECYKIIFGKDAKPDYLLKREDAAEVIKKACDENRVTPKMYFLTVMFGYREANPDGKFYSTMLMGDAAVRRLSKYRSAIADQYGSFDESSLDQYTGEGMCEMTTEKRLLESEILAGSWIAGFKLKHGGSPDKDFYSVNEHRLSELWLAIEPTYFDEVLHPWTKDKAGTSAQNKLRSRVARIVIELKRNSKKAISVFRAREKIMPQAIETVLAQRGFQPGDFEVETGKPFSSSIAFWSKMGLAWQHYYCWRMVQGDKFAEKMLSSGLIQS